MEKYELYKIKDAKAGAFFHGEEWYRCPYCGKAFEIWSAVYGNDGIHKVANQDGCEVFQCSCGEMFKIY